ncbi:MAG: c-type cytochrome [Betaproteobacteria bacterium]|nr:c-type cytochrome [Betaproteobacteria bacterium]
MKTSSFLGAMAAIAGFTPAIAENETALSAGSFTSADQSASAYLVTVSVHDEELRGLISSGRRMFNETWVLPTEYTGVWGVGPTFNENSCLQCHASNGRARAPEHGAAAEKGLLVRLSIPGASAEGGPNPHPLYGEQLQNRGVKNQVPREGKIIVHYDEVVRTFPDGETVKLRRPKITITELSFGELGQETMLSPRIAPALVGLGLLEAIPEETILNIAAQQQGVSGVPNYVWDVEAKSKVLGRFGWKANQPSLRQQTAAAFHGDIGATSPLFPAENCPEGQTQCLNGPTATGCGGGRDKCTEDNYWEVLPSRLRNVTLYMQALAVPARRAVEHPEVKRGALLFTQAQCSACHVPEMKTGANTAIPAAANQIIRPYTDLLLHDMGEELADHRPDFQASGSEWRTPPLWGLGLQKAVNGHTNLLHDGRARDFTEAILWHGGEASAARAKFMEMPRDERQALMRFLDSL